MRIIASLLYKLAKCALNFAFKLTLRLSCVYLRIDCDLGLRNVVEWKVIASYCCPLISFRFEFEI